MHKFIQPETVVIFNPTQANSKHQSFPYTFGSAYLAGFERFRIRERGSLSKDEDLVPRNIYLHPQHRGSRPLVDYVVFHNIYSRGVVLPEIGLWESLIDGYEGTNRYRFVLGLDERMYQVHQDKESVQRWLVKTSEVVLPRVMGNQYSKAVKARLTCVKGGSCRLNYL